MNEPGINNRKKFNENVHPHNLERSLAMCTVAHLIWLYKEAFISKNDIKFR